jgi:rubredoxin
METTDYQEWCIIHNRVEEACKSDFKACSECGHIYRTAGDLLDEFRKRCEELKLIAYNGIPVELIYSCPLCGHDF